MRWSLKYQLIVSLAFLGATGAFARSHVGRGKPRPVHLTVRVYNYAHIGFRRRAWAQHRCAWILKAAGVEAGWLDCLNPGAAQPIVPACRGPLSPGEINLNLLDRPSDLGAAISNSAIGDAIGPDFAEIFCGRIQAFADNLDGPDRFSAVLGFAMAHEIGHLLLGPDAHSPSGIMQGHWNLSVVEEASWNLAQFTPAQGQAMRAQILKRQEEYEDNSGRKLLAHASRATLREGDHH